MYLRVIFCCLLIWPIVSPKVAGAESFVLVIETEIRDLGILSVQTGMKSRQIVRVDADSLSASTEFETGITDILVADLPSVRDMFELRSVDFGGETFVIDVRGQTASMISVFGDIDYQFTIRINSVQRLAFISGCHNSFPSYSITIDGSTLYDREQTGTAVTGLIGACDIVVGETGISF